MAAGWIARGAVGAAEKGGESVKEREDKIKGMSREQAKAALLTAVFAPQKIALLKKLADEKALGDIDIKRYLNDETKKMFNSYGQNKAFGDIEKSAGISVEMLRAFGNSDYKEVLRLAEEHVSKISKGDINKSSIKDLFSGKAKFGLDESSLKTLSGIITQSIANSNPALVSAIVPKLDSKSRKNFKDSYQKAINGVSVMENQKKIQERFDKMMGNYDYG